MHQSAARSCNKKQKNQLKKMGKNGFIASSGWLRHQRKYVQFLKETMENKNKLTCRIINEKKKEKKKELPENVYDADNMYFCFKALPEHMYLFMNERTKRHKIFKCITVLCCIIMTGQKRKYFSYWKIRNPHLFLQNG